MSLIITVASRWCITGSVRASALLDVAQSIWDLLKGRLWEYTVVAIIHKQKTRKSVPSTVPHKCGLKLSGVHWCSTTWLSAEPTSNLYFFTFQSVQTPYLAWWNFIPLAVIYKVPVWEQLVHNMVGRGRILCQSVSVINAQSELIHVCCVLPIIG